MKKCSVRVFHEESEFWHILLIQTILSVVFIISKSIIFYPPLLFSPTNVIFLILEGLLCQIKVKIMVLIWSDKFLGKLRLELLKINFDDDIYFSNYG